MRLSVYNCNIVSFGQKIIITKLSLLGKTDLMLVSVYKKKVPIITCMYDNNIKIRKGRKYKKILKNYIKLQPPLNIVYILKCNDTTEQTWNSK